MKTSKMTESLLWICSKELSFMYGVLSIYYSMPSILDTLLWKNLTKYKELEKNTTVIVLTKKRPSLPLQLAAM